MNDEELLKLLQQDAMPPQLQRAMIREQQLKQQVVDELKRRLGVQPVDQSDPEQDAANEIQIGEETMSLEEREFIDLLETSETDQAATFQATNITAKAIDGPLFGVATIELHFEHDDEQPRLFPDQPLTIVESAHRVFYPTFEVAYRARAGEHAWRASKLTCHFLFRGTAKLNCSLHSGESTLLSQQLLAVENDPAAYGLVRSTWWRTFSKERSYIADPQREIHRFLVESLARRLDLQIPSWKTQHEQTFVKKDLEHQFEHSVRLLLGIESVALAMQQNADYASIDPHEIATLPMPAARPLRSVPVPPVPATVSIEPIAAYVPEECFYVRAGNLANYRWFRQFLLRWGGTLDDIVAQNAIATETRQNLQQQLALYPESLSIADADRLIDDIALIGLDPFFGDGAAVGVLVKASDHEGVLELIRSHRQRCMQDFPDAREQKVWIGRNAVLKLTGPAQRIRSFYAIHGEYHLVSNSQTLVQRFFEAAEGKQSLAQLNEFRYARHSTRSINNAAVFLYLSDPFFRNLISPHTRVEMMRRQRSIDNIRHVRMAHLMARAEALPVTSIDELVKARFLSADVDLSVDDTRWSIRGTRVIDSLRGTVGSFVPIADMPKGKISLSEKRAYHAFIARYSKEWPMMDPVNLILTRDITPTTQEQRVGMHIMIAPYATQRYDALSRHLAPPTRTRVVPKSDDLISVDTTIQTQLGGGTRHTFYAALRDADVDYKIENGEIHLLGKHHGSYARTYSYAAFSPPSFEVVRLLARNFAGIDLPAQGRSTRRTASPIVTPPPTGIISNPPAAIVWLVANFAASGGVSRMAADAIPMLVDGQWAIVSLNAPLRQDLQGTLHTAPLGRPSQVYLRMGELEGSRVESYIDAYTYLNARRISAQNARWITDFAQQFHISPQQANRTLQYVIDAEVVCPLGGTFQRPVGAGVPLVVSDRWNHSTLYHEVKVPESWRFPFLDWIRQLEIDFQLQRPKLLANVKLLVRSETPLANQEVVFRAFKPPVDFDELGVIPVQLDEAAQQPWPEARKSEPVSQLSFETDSLNSRPSRLTQETSLRSDSNSDWILGVRVQMTNESATGAKVQLVHPGSPAIRSELRVGDLIMAVNGRDVTDAQLLRRAVEEAAQHGNDILLRIRRNDQAQTIFVPLRDERRR